MKCNRLSFFFLVVLSAFSLNAADAELFTPRYDVKHLNDWGPGVVKVEPVTFNQEAPNRAMVAQALSFGGERRPVSVDVRVRGVGYRANLTKAIVHERGTSWWIHLEGAKVLSHHTNSDHAVAGELFLPDGRHFSLITRNQVTYLVEWDEEEISRSLVNDVVVEATSSRKRRAVRSAERPPMVCGENEEEVENFDLMMPYTKLAREWFSSDPKVGRTEIEAAGQNGVDGTNATTINSTGKFLKRVNLVYMFEVDYVEAGSRGGWLSEDITWAYNSPAVKAAADLHDIDVVQLLVVSGDKFGAGAAVPPGTTQEGFSVASVKGGARTKMHESGHMIWGMDHHPETARTPRLVEWGVDHYVDGVASGVMATALADKNLCPRGCPWQPVWANYQVNYPDTGVPSGIKGERHNVGMLDYWGVNSLSGRRISGKEKQCVPVSNIATAHYNDVNF